MGNYGGGYGGGGNRGYGTGGGGGFGPGSGKRGGYSTGGGPRPDGPGGKGGLDGFDPGRPYTSRLAAVGRFVMRFGKYKDASLDQLAGDDEALLYLDWLRSKEDFTGLSRDLVTIFLHQPTVAERLDAAIRARRSERRDRP